MRVRVRVRVRVSPTPNPNPNQVRAFQLGPTLGLLSYSACVLVEAAGLTLTLTLALTLLEYPYPNPNPHPHPNSNPNPNPNQVEAAGLVTLPRGSRLGVRTAAWPNSSSRHTRCAGPSHGLCWSQPTARGTRVPCPSGPLLPPPWCGSMAAGGGNPRGTRMP